MIVGRCDVMYINPGRQNHIHTRCFFLSPHEVPCIYQGPHIYLETFKPKLLLKICSLAKKGGVSVCRIGPTEPANVTKARYMKKRKKHAGETELMRPSSFSFRPGR